MLIPPPPSPTGRHVDAASGRDICCAACRRWCIIVWACGFVSFMQRRAAADCERRGTRAERAVAAAQPSRAAPRRLWRRRWTREPTSLVADCARGPGRAALGRFRAARGAGAARRRPTSLVGVSSLCMRSRVPGGPPVRRGPRCNETVLAARRVGPGGRRQDRRDGPSTRNGPELQSWRRPDLKRVKQCSAHRPFHEPRAVALQSSPHARPRGPGPRRAQRLRQQRGELDASRKAARTAAHRPLRCPDRRQRPQQASTLLPPRTSRDRAAHARCARLVAVGPRLQCRSRHALLRPRPAPLARAMD